MQGWLDSVRPRQINGWACDDLGHPPELTLLVNGEPKARSRPDQTRSDLASMFGSSVAFGLDCDFPEPIRIGDDIDIVDDTGHHVPGAPQQVTKLDGGKKERATSLLDRSMRVLEIGLSFNPIASRADGWNSFSLDHLSQEELRSKYAGQQPIENIEPVDFIWHGGPLTDAVPKELHGTFDAIIISHVIEHFLDPIDFYLAAAELLREDGIISLVVPDKRYMFDHFKPISLTSDLLEAHRSETTRHSFKSAFNNIAYNVFESGAVAWSQQPVKSFSFASGPRALDDAKSVFDTVVTNESGPYIDFHHTIHTPLSFQVIILELVQLGMIPFTIALTYPPNGCEFYASLKNSKIERANEALLAEARLHLMKKIVREQAEQALWLLNE